MATLHKTRCSLTFASSNCSENLRLLAVEFTSVWFGIGIPLGSLFQLEVQRLMTDRSSFQALTSDTSGSLRHPRMHADKRDSPAHNETDRVSRGHLRTYAGTLIEPVTWWVEHEAQQHHQLTPPQVIVSTHTWTYADFPPAWCYTTLNVIIRSSTQAVKGWGTLGDINLQLMNCSHICKELVRTLYK